MARSPLPDENQAGRLRSFAMYRSPCAVPLLFLLCVWLLAASAGTGRAAEKLDDPLEAILRPVVKPTMAHAVENYRKKRRYRESDFPMNEADFVAFQNDVVTNFARTLKLTDWIVRDPDGKQNALAGKYRDRLLQTITHHGVRMEVHLIEIVETGYRIPAVVCLPDGEDRRPGICVFSGHSRHGLRDLTIDLENRVQRGLATRLAQAGFVTIAVEKIDTGYLSKTFPDGSDERELAPHLLSWGRVVRAQQLMACLAAAEILAQHPRVDESRMGAAGVSLGGWLSMQTALLNHRITAVADFGMKELHVDPHIKPAEFKGEFQMGGNADLCHCLPGMLSICDRNLLSLPYCPRRLLAGHGRRDKLSHGQALTHYKAVFEKQYAALGKPENFQYVLHEGGDVMPDQTVIVWFREVFGQN